MKSVITIDDLPVEMREDLFRAKSPSDADETFTSWDEVFYVDVEDRNRLWSEA